MLISEMHAHLAQVRAELIGKLNVVGVGIGEKITGGRRTGETAYIVLVRKKQDVARADAIPDTIHGVKTDVIEVGEIVAHANLTRVRPVPGGVSIGNAAGVTVGTLGYYLRNEADRQL